MVNTKIRLIIHLPSGSDSKASVCNTGDPGSIPGLGRYPGEGNGSPLQYSCLEKSHGLQSLVGYRPWGRRVGHDWVTSLHFILFAAEDGEALSVQFSSVAQLCWTLCDPMDCSTQGFLVHLCLLEPTQTHVHRIGDAIQLSHPLSSRSPPAFNLAQQQSLFQCRNTL